MDENKVKKVLALLAKANDPGAPEPEREAFREKAYELLVKWGIDDATLASVQASTPAGAPREEVQIREVRVSDVPKNFQREAVYLFGVVAESQGARGFSIQLYYTADGRPNRTPEYGAVLVGFAADLDRTELVATTLLRQAMTDMYVGARLNPDWRYMRDADKDKWKRAFLVGFSARVDTRLRALYQAARQQASAGTDLVLVRRETEIQSVVNDMGVQRARARSFDEDGLRSGAVAGSKALIGQTEVAADAADAPARPALTGAAR